MIYPIRDVDNIDNTGKEIAYDFESMTIFTDGTLFLKNINYET